jgi:hypothetical protein
MPFPKSNSSLQSSTITTQAHLPSLAAHFSEIGYHQDHSEVKSDKPNENANVPMPIRKLIAILQVLLDD